MAEAFLIKKELLQLISPSQAWDYEVIPAEKREDEIEFFCAEQSRDVQEELELFLGTNVTFKLMSRSQINEFLIKYYPRTQTKNTLHQFSSNFDDFLPKIIEEAKTLQSSDIHIEAYERDCRIRFRVDGKLTERYRFEKKEYPALINKVKIQANLDIAEKRLPQDGRIFYRSGNEKIDIRVSIAPALYGEKVVMRLLSKNTENLQLDRLGFATDQLEEFLVSIEKPYGIVLISGPTGSGKTTTLYASLKHLNNESNNILTIEDPIEYTLEGVNQLQVNEGIGLTFAQALRTFLRQDPDIIMLGEIRDKETAQMAIRASLTGHLVFSTIHTNSAWGTITRLRDMGLPSYILAETINVSVAQRLLRLLCNDCKKEVEISEQDKNVLNGYTDRTTHFVPNGCEKCYFTGYDGRKAIYEILKLDDYLIDHLKQDTTSEPLELNYRTLKQQALELYTQNKTSLLEIISYLRD
jgi:general secretion pathway protein E/type IV pilus assembly protein PilB